MDKMKATSPGRLKRFAAVIAVIATGTTLQIFSVWNIVAYLTGITVAAAIDHVLTVKRCSAHTPQSWPLHDPDDNITGPGGRAPSLLARSY